MANDLGGSRLFLEVHLQGSPAQPHVSYRNADGADWEHNPAALVESASADSLWGWLNDDWNERHNRLLQAGAALGMWLFDERAARYLREGVEANKRREDRQRLRIELRLDRDWLHVPWEIAALDGVGPLAVQSVVTVVRRSDLGHPKPPPVGSAEVLLCGVKLDRHDGWVDLQTDEELNLVQEELCNQAMAGRYRVELNALGEWEHLVKRYQDERPAHVFHFAGHGVGGGDGLLFRAADGLPKIVPGHKIANLLANTVAGRKTRMVFLNACRSVGGERGPHQPFGGMAWQLIQNGVPMVAGMQTPVEDAEAMALAQTFYGALGKGRWVDCAVQEAREKLYYLGHGVGWAFFSLYLSGEPTPLMQTGSNIKPKVTELDFGFDAQLIILKKYLFLRRPVVVVVHGDLGSGHAHFLKQIKEHLIRQDIYLDPVFGFKVDPAGEAQFYRVQLAARLADTLGLPSGGSPDELEDRIARAIADRRESDKVVVYQISDVVSLNDKRHVETLLELAGNLWIGLMEKARQYRGQEIASLLVLPVAVHASVSIRRVGNNEKWWQRVVGGIMEICSRIYDQGGNVLMETFLQGMRGFKQRGEFVKILNR